MMRGIWDRETIALMLLAAAFPIAAAWLLDVQWEGLARLLFFLVVAGIWHVIFMLVRAQPPSFAGALTALAIAMLAPEDNIAYLKTHLGAPLLADIAFSPAPNPRAASMQLPPDWP